MIQQNNPKNSTSRLIAFGVAIVMTVATVSVVVNAAGRKQDPAGMLNLKKNMDLIESGLPDNTPIVQDSNPFQYVAEAKNFREAQAYCRTTYGTSLASIHTTNGNLLMAQQILAHQGSTHSDVWIGGYQPGSYLTWVDGTVMNWVAPIVSIAGTQSASWKDCLAFRRVNSAGVVTRRWIKELCGNRRPFMCWKASQALTCYASPAWVDEKYSYQKYVPNCPVFSANAMTFANAKSHCYHTDKCVAFSIMSQYTHWSQRNSVGTVKFYQSSSQCDARVHLPYAERGLAYFMRQENANPSCAR